MSQVPRYGYWMHFKNCATIPEIFQGLVDPSLWLRGDLTY